MVKSSKCLNWTTSLVFLASLGVLTVHVPEYAYAQEKEKPLDEKTTKRVVGYIKGAKAFSSQGKHEKALELYSEAYALLPKPALLYVMAQSAEKAGKRRLAIKYYEDMVQQMPESSKSKEVMAYLPKLKSQVAPRLTINSKPDGANVYLNNPSTSPIGSTPYKGEFKPGTYAIILKLDGYEPTRTQVVLKSADDETLDVALKVAGDGKDVVVEPSPKAAESFSAAGWVTTSLGAALLGTGVVFSALQSSKVEEVKAFDKRANLDPVAAREEFQRLKKESNDYWSSSMMLYIAGGVVSVAGVALLLSSSGEQEVAVDESALKLDLSLAPHGGFVSIYGSF